MIKNLIILALITISSVFGWTLYEMQTTTGAEIARQPAAIAEMTEGGAINGMLAVLVEALPQLVYTIAIEFFVKRDAFRECNENLEPSLSAGRSESKRTH